MATLARIRRTALGLAALAGATTGVAHADPPRATLVVTRGPGAEDCPDQAALTSRVHSMVGGVALEASTDTLLDTWIQVELLHELSGYRAIITARGKREGTRTLTDVSPSCASLADALAITIVLLLDPEPIPVKSPPPPAAEPAAPPRREPPFARLGVEAGGGASFGLLYHPTPLIEGGARLALGRRALIAGGGTFLFPDRILAPGGSVTLGLWYAYVRGGWTVVDRPGARLVLSGGPLLGSLSGEGNGYTYTPTRHTFWGAAALGAELLTLLGGSFSLTTRLVGLVEPVSEGFSTRQGDEATDAFRTSPFGAILTLGVTAEQDSE